MRVRNPLVPSQREPNPKCHKQKWIENLKCKHKLIRGTNDVTIMHCLGSIFQPCFPKLSSIFRNFFSHGDKVAIITPFSQPHNFKPTCKKNFFGTSKFHKNLEIFFSYMSKNHTTPNKSQCPTVYKR